MARNIKLSVSNIAWEEADSEAVYSRMNDLGFAGLEVAPPKLFGNSPYEHTEAARQFLGRLKSRYGFSVPSMQSIWYGRTENLFEPEQARVLVDYTKQAFAFARALRCPSLVFGCPSNRRLPTGADPGSADAVFDELGAIAQEYGAVLAIEANAKNYTNFITSTAEAFDLAARLRNPGLAVNLDLGTVIANGESLKSFEPMFAYVSHIHISEPNLRPIQRRDIHRELAEMVKQTGYSGYVSIEMGRTDVNTVCDALGYIAEVFD